MSTAYEREGPRSLISITPFARYNSMEMIPNWTLTFDLQRSKTQNASGGLLARYRHDFTALDAKLILGTDVDYSPGSRFERIIGVTRQNNVFTSFRDSMPVYDYDVTFHGVSPYAHLELSPLRRCASRRAPASTRWDTPTTTS